VRMSSARTAIPLVRGPGVHRQECRYSVDFKARTLRGIGCPFGNPAERRSRKLLKRLVGERGLLTPGLLVPNRVQLPCPRAANRALRKRESWPFMRRASDPRSLNIGIRNTAYLACWASETARLWFVAVYQPGKAWDQAPPKEQSSDVDAEGFIKIRFCYVENRGELSVELRLSYLTCSAAPVRAADIPGVVPHPPRTSWARRKRWARDTRAPMHVLPGWLFGYLISLCS